MMHLVEEMPERCVIRGTFVMCFACGRQIISRSEKTPSLLIALHMSTDTEYSSGLGKFVVCQELTSVGKQDLKERKKW